MKSRLHEYAEGAVAWVIQRVIEDTYANPEMKQLGRSHLGILGMLQGWEIGQKVAANLTKQDILEHVKWRRHSVGPATANHDVTFLSLAIKTYSATWDEPDFTAALVAIATAKKYLVKRNIIGKANVRTRVPTDDEVDSLMAYFQEHDAHPRAEIKMCPVLAFALVSTRRRGEICRIRRSDIDWQRGTYMVRDVKNPKGSKGNHKTFPLFPELADIIKRQPVLDPNDPDECVFPYESNSVGQLYCKAKKELGIVGLRFHDNRRAAITRWLKTLPPHKVRQISGHETTLILERVYAAPKPEDLLAEVAAARGA